MSQRDELIDLFARYSVAEVSQSAEHGNLVKQWGKSEAFLALYNRIDGLKRELEVLFKGRAGREQVTFGIQQLREYESDPDKFRDCAALIQKAYSPGWNEAQRTHFRKAVSFLSENEWWFLSFTNRNNTPEETNVINQEHRYLIEDVFFPKDPFKEKDPRKNLLAEAIRKRLRDKARDGFFYPDHEGDNSVVETKLRGACDRALNFVQLIQGVMFESASPNFCLFEYDHIKKAGDKEPLFLLAEPRDDLLNRQILTPLSLKPWLQDILSRNPPTLIPTPEHDSATIKSNREELKKVVDQVIKAVRALLTEVPPD